jgi:hypothetical protein
MAASYPPRCVLVMAALASQSIATGCYFAETDAGGAPTGTGSPGETDGGQVQQTGEVREYQIHQSPPAGVEPDEAVYLTVDLASGGTSEALTDSLKFEWFQGPKDSEIPMQELAGPGVRVRPSATTEYAVYVFEKAATQPMGTGRHVVVVENVDHTGELKLETTTPTPVTTCARFTVAVRATNSDGQVVPITDVFPSVGSCDWTIALDGAPQMSVTKDRCAELVVGDANPQFPLPDLDSEPGVYDMTVTAHGDGVEGRTATTRFTVTNEPRCAF